MKYEATTPPVGGTVVGPLRPASVLLAGEGKVAMSCPPVSSRRCAPSHIK
jgi:hypothetical protein